MAAKIEVGSTVTYKGDPDPGTVVELSEQTRRARVDWGKGLPPNWVPLHALTLVESPK